ncbi:hypothetical protein [Coxiella-like endosymbiont]|uniref:hypothetical protein n=1 Tax=Coxiella-like endosymbiont TaxID=1592897 RepID=UPI00272CE4CE|nr:hypothetical protein [Coxiella-like endosymbiont]
MKKNLKINKYCIYKDKKQIAGKTEKKFYELFGISYIESELLENHGEIEAALKHQLPKLIILKDN